MEFYLWMAGSLPFIILGSIHLIYTFFTNKFSTRNPQLEAEMKVSSPVLTNQTSMWKAWIGFNASHSIGAMYFGLINFSLAAIHAPFLFHPIFMVLHICTVAFYLWLGIKYWFSIPLTGIAISSILFLIAFAIALAH
jgi:hypothetical protein